MYDAARVVGEQVARVDDTDRAALERDGFKFNVHLSAGGPNLAAKTHNLYMIYPQGNPLEATGRFPLPANRRRRSMAGPFSIAASGYDHTTLEEVARKFALISLDSTMRSRRQLVKAADRSRFSTAPATWR